MTGAAAARITSRCVARLEEELGMTRKPVDPKLERGLSTQQIEDVQVAMEHIDQALVVLGKATVFNGTAELRTARRELVLVLRKEGVRL